MDEVLVRTGGILPPSWPAALGNRAHTLARVQSNVLALLALATGGDVPGVGAVDLDATARLRASRRGPVRMFHRNGYFGLLVEARPGVAV